MNPVYSKHQNLNAEPNVPGLDPHYRRHDRSGNALASLALIIIGIVLGAPAGAALSAGFRNYDKLAKTCQMCHNITTQTPVIFETLGEFKRFKRMSL